MSHRFLQLPLELDESRSKVSGGARDAANFTPWPQEQRESEVARAVAEALAAMIHLSEDRRIAERLPRMVEMAVLASDAGPGGVNLLEQVDRALSQACGRDHGLLEGKYL